MDGLGVKQKLHPVIKRTQAPLANNKVGPRTPDELSLPSNLPNKINVERKEGSHHRADTDIAELKAVPTFTGISVLEQTAELEGTVQFTQDKTRDQYEKEIEKSAGVLNLPIKSKIANMKLKLPFHLSDLKRNDSLGTQHHPKFQDSNHKETNDKEVPSRQINPFGGKIQSQSSLQIGGCNDRSDKNLIEEPLSAEGRTANYSLAKFTDGSGQKEASEALFSGRNGITKTIGSVFARRSNVYLL